MRAGLLGLVVAAAQFAILAAAPAFAATRVVATTTDLAALVAVVGGDLVTVESIVPAGVDPEAFEPRPGDLAKVRQAALLVRVGLGYDYWLDGIVNQTGDKRLMRGGEAYVDASTGIPLLEIRGQSVVNEGGHAHGVANPHYWLDPENAITVTAGIAEALVRNRARAAGQDPRQSRAISVRARDETSALEPDTGAVCRCEAHRLSQFVALFRAPLSSRCRLPSSSRRRALRRARPISPS